MSSPFSARQSACPKVCHPVRAEPANFESGTKLGPCSADESEAESPDCATARPAKHIARRHTANVLLRRLTISSTSFHSSLEDRWSLCDRMRSKIDLGRLI